MLFNTKTKKPQIEIIPVILFFKRINRIHVFSFLKHLFAGTFRNPKNLKTPKPSPSVYQSLHQISQH